MKAKTLNNLLKKSDRIAVSNITGREASGVTVISQKYSSNIIGGWALGKGGEKIDVPKTNPIPVFSDFETLVKKTPKNRYPNKIIVYSPPPAVYGDVKEVIKYGLEFVETIFIITENVSIEVTAKIKRIAKEANIDVIGCNTLGIINTHDHVRVGAVGGDNPDESFKKGTVTIISNSGNMVNTMSSYLLSGGLGTSFGISTGKDALILTPLVEFLKLAEKDKNTKLIVLYIEPGGLYELEAIEYLKKNKFPKPIIVYVAGKILEKNNLSLGHAGAVIEGNNTSASAKMKLFDDYFGNDVFNRKKQYKKTDLKHGIRIAALHDLPQIAQLIYHIKGWQRDYEKYTSLKLNPWCLNLGSWAKKLPLDLVLGKGTIPEPYKSQLEKLDKSTLGAAPARMDMRNRSLASFNDGRKVKVYGKSLMELMEKHSFSEAVILYWTGEMPRHEFETKLVDMCLMASLTNGPGTISAQGAKLSASAGNDPNTAMISTLACIGTVHGGNGRKAVKFLIDIFRDLDFDDPYNFNNKVINVKELALKKAKEFMAKKTAAKDAGTDYERIPCIGHPVFRGEEVNYDPRERAVFNYLKKIKKTNVFLEFYYCLVQSLKDVGAMRNIFAVNVDAVIACIWLGVCWRSLKQSRITKERVFDIPFISFALGRVAGGAGEFLDHQDHGSPMDMRIPVSECR